MKKLVSIILSLLIICPLLTACNGKGMGIGKVKQTNKELTIYINEGTKFKYQSGIYAFKNEHKDINVNIVDYSQMSFDEFGDKLSAEILAGKGPDVIALDHHFFRRRDVYKMMTSGVFANLNSFTKKDKDLNAGNFNMTVIKGGAIDGDQYIMPTNYRIPILLTTQTTMKETNINLEENDSYMGLMDQLIKYVKETRNNPDSRRVFRLTKSLRYYTNYMGLNILDYKNKKVNINTPEFKQATQQYKELYLQETAEVGEEVNGIDEATDALFNKKSIFENCTNTGSFDGVLMQASATLNFDTPIMVPLRDVDGGMQAMISNAFAIRSNSPNQQNAYDLIKYLMSETVQDSVYPLEIPIAKKSILHISEHYKKNGSIKYISSSGEIKFPRKDVPEEFLKKFYDLTQQPTGAYLISPILVDKIWDGMEPYFKGERSYDECVKELQGNLEIYISE